MNLYYLDNHFVLAVNTLADVEPVHPSLMLNEAIGQCVDITLHGRRFRVWTHDEPALNAFTRACAAVADPSAGDVEAAVEELGHYGLHLEVLSGYPDELHGAQCRVLVERSEYEDDYEVCAAHLALYAATGYDPDACRAYVNSNR